MTSLTAPLRLRLQTPADVLAAVPYLLGFHPADSVVLLGLRGGGLSFHARADLPPADAAPAQVAAFARYLGEVLRVQAVTGVLLVGYGAAERVTAALRAVAETATALGLTVFEQLRAEPDRYWSYLCTDPACCPPDGTPYQVAGTVIAAEATLAGCVALPDRAALVRTLGPPTAEALTAIRAATAAARQRHAALPADEAAEAGRRAVRDALARHGAGGRLTDDEVAWLTVLLASDNDLRSHAVDLVDARRPAAVPRAAHTDLWTDVLRRCDPELVLSPALLTAYACWRDGDGVRASVAVERALAADPDCPAAHLMADVLQSAMPPTVASRQGRPTGRGQRQRRQSRRPRAARPEAQ